MATQQSPSGPLVLHQQPYPPTAAPGVAAAGSVRPPQPNGAMAMAPSQPGFKTSGPPHLSASNEETWLQLGALSELMGELDGAIQSYERALTFNTWSVRAMLAISCILRSKDQFTSAVEYLRQIIKVEPNNGEVWSSLGHCYLMMDDLQQAYSAYQQALYHLPDPKEPKLWYGIGILYDRYGSLEHAEEAFSQVMRMEPNFEKANEIYFRLGIIYKQQQKFQQSLECFRYIVNDPPRPLSEEDIWFQIGHVHEQQKDYDSAKAAYTRVLERDPNHAKVLQQLGWLHHQQSTSFSSQEQAIEYLEKSVSSDQTDAQSWYLLGRCYMSQQKYPKAYEAYQQAVYRDGRNPTFWCSIGVLYYQINQYRDALDAYSRAIRLNPNISEVWYDLGTLYESCNNQTSDALDAYSRAADLDPTNVHIKARLALLKGQSTNGLPTQNPAPLPQDVHPQAYQPGAHGPPGPQWGAHAQNPPPPGPAPPPLSGGSWGPNRLADLQNPQMPPQSLNPFEQRDRLPPPPQQQQQQQPPPPPQQQQGLPRPPSPRQEVSRYQDQPQRQPPPSHRGLSPSPKGQHTAPYSASTAHPAGPPLAELPRPSYGVSMSSGPPPANGLTGVSNHNALPPYSRASEQPQEIRPLATPTPGAGHYPRNAYEHHPTNNTMSIAGVAPPSTVPQGQDSAHRDREERPGSAAPIKRHREWEDDPNSSASKKPQTDESRSRLDEIKMQRPSPSEKIATPPHHSPSDLRRLEEPPRPSSAYHPSEAAHHPPSLPSLHNMTQPAMRASAPPQEEHRAPPPPAPQSVSQVGHQSQGSRPPSPRPSTQAAPPVQPPVTQSTPVYEPAARKIEIDESYDTDDDKSAKSATKQEPRKDSPKPNGNANAALPPVGGSEAQN